MAESSTSSEQPFTVAVPDDALALLRAKLDTVRFPDELDGAGWDYGAPLADVNAHLDSSVKVGRGLPNVGGLLSPVTKKVGRDLLDVDAAADADVKVGHAVEANANADAEIEVLDLDRRHDGSLLSLVDTAIVDITVSAHALSKPFLFRPLSCSDISPSLPPACQRHG